MNTNRIGSPYPASIGEQRPAVDALVRLAAMFGTLPPAYITVTTTARNQVDLLLDSPHDFEVWREALGVPTDSVSWHVHSGSVWIAAAIEVHGAVVKMSGHGVPVSSELAKVSPAQDAECPLPAGDESEPVALPAEWSAAVSA